jgi:hypothetical protein
MILMRLCWGDRSTVSKLAQFAFASCIAAVSCSGARAQQTQAEWLPEIDTYVNITDRYRLMFVAARSTDANTVNSAQFGPNLDINFRPLRRRVLHTNDSTNNSFVTFRTGYQYIKNFGKPNENRVQFALTSRFHLPWSMELAERNRFDLRIINDQFSWRYRNRLTLARSFTIKSFRFSPYARGEIYYYSTTGTWSKNTYSFGATFPVRKRFELEGYYERENTTGGVPPHVNGIGMTLGARARAVDGIYLADTHAAMPACCKRSPRRKELGASRAASARPGVLVQRACPRELLCLTELVLPYSASPGSCSNTSNPQKRRSNHVSTDPNCKSTIRISGAVHTSIEGWQSLEPGSGRNESEAPARSRRLP